MAEPENMRDSFDTLPNTEAPPMSSGGQGGEGNLEADRRYRDHS